MRLSELFIRVAVFAFAAVLCVVAARATVQTVERTSVAAVETALEERGLGFASVIGDGLQIVLEGEAGSEAERFRAISTAGQMVDASRVIDNMSVEDPTGIAPPEFSMEILRNDSGISIIGLIPDATDRARLNARLEKLVEDPGQVADLLEAADYPRPAGWEPAVDYGIRALAALPRSKVSVRAGRVTVEAIADSDTEKARLERDLARNRPDGVEVALQIMAPRPVITPFTTRFVKDDTGARFESCLADTPEAEERIVAAARAAGAEGRVGCTLALGAPSGTWAHAVALSIAAVADLGGGTVTLSDADITLIAPQGTAEGRFDSVAGALENALPDLFALEAVLPQAPEDAPEGPPQFIATLSPEGLVQLRGRVSDALLNTTAENYARARFGSNDIAMGTRVVEGLPDNWSVRVLAGLDALSTLSNGSVVVEPGRVAVRGKSGDEDAGAKVSRMLIDKLGEDQDFEIEVTYVEELDPIAALPTDEECLGQIQTVTADRKITFEPGSATISGPAISVVDDIAEILRRCADLRIEIAGYTDSQGREVMNQRLSQQRAEAVLAALRMRRVPTSSFRAVGYGEQDPIADNDTKAGREANRRIEFSLIETEGAAEAAGAETTLDEVAAGAADDGEGGEDAATGETNE
ncbi:OmpA family protein [Salibaculum sp.]|uniref:OmpA family protein n=1 Tax=Salibaculum sp. TaxID=2855480 RepID=UPI002B4A95E7|nr:OmpA family protein [Salibaculum sp.]HKL70040.1 OmpA family protein [Salibaculum sp.]